ncbi:pyruvate dehydrogenase (acetyl-transferring) E1 component subunit alpha [Haladaptatus sp. DYF46]|uniref:pyruvate dehydrogenase (acetyl-transferring) E1 component subunit alpha n=1 Tax=Haladaptatus sp. DYF46 TaxID=2886041 RepID=UPI001E628769|nr:pyruvate dehydrogenase (acetyl-transferring) E1 component subunit alpha [Haladaptatus sp. DYF46]
MAVGAQERDVVKVLEEDGSIVDKSAISGLSDEFLREMYTKMKLVHRYDKRAISLQRQGRIGTYPPLQGHEATQVASVLALDDGDQLFPSYRENGAIITQSDNIEKNLLLWMGHEIGNAFSKNSNVFPIANPIATQIPHATGYAWASKLNGDKAATLCHFGDGATSEGDFHEALNFAGVFDIPVIFLCNNNQWAISTPRVRQTKSRTLSQKAQAYGLEGVRVDGMDPLAVYSVVRDAVKKAKHPEKKELRPTLIESVLYRLGAHSTSDDPSVYRDEKQTKQWNQKEPIRRFELFLLKTGRLTTEGVETIESKIDQKIENAIENAESFESDPEEMFKYVYETLPQRIDQQCTTVADLPRPEPEE